MINTRLIRQKKGLHILLVAIIGLTACNSNRQVKPYYFDYYSSRIVAKKSAVPTDLTDTTSQVLNIPEATMMLANAENGAQVARESNYVERDVSTTPEKSISKKIDNDPGQQYMPKKKKHITRVQDGKEKVRNPKRNKFAVLGVVATGIGLFLIFSEAFLVGSLFVFGGLIFSAIATTSERRGLAIFGVVISSVIALIMFMSIVIINTFGLY